MYMQSPVPRLSIQTCNFHGSISLWGKTLQESESALPVKLVPSHEQIIAPSKVRPNPLSNNLQQTLSTHACNLITACHEQGCYIIKKYALFSGRFHLPKVNFCFSLLSIHFLLCKYVGLVDEGSAHVLCFSFLS